MENSAFEAPGHIQEPNLEKVLSTLWKSLFKDKEKAIASEIKKIW